MSNASKIAKAQNILKACSTKALLEQFNLTEKMRNSESYMVRGWIMDELECRNEQAFNQYLDDCGTEQEKPIEHYFL